MIDLNLPALREAVAKMTPGPWVQRKPAHWVSTDAHIGWEHIFKALSDRNRDNDAAGLVALRNAAPDLLYEMERLRKENAKLSQQLSESHEAFCENGHAEHKDCTSSCACVGMGQSRMEMLDAENERLRADLAAARAVLDGAEDTPGSPRAHMARIRRGLLLLRVQDVPAERGGAGGLRGEGEGAMTDLPALREAVAKMTEGPWCRLDHNGSIITGLGDLVIDETENDADADGIVALRNAAPALLDEVEAAQARWAKLKTWLRAGNSLPDFRTVDPVARAIEGVVKKMLEMELGRE